MQKILKKSFIPHVWNLPNLHLWKDGKCYRMTCIWNHRGSKQDRIHVKIHLQIKTGVWSVFCCLCNGDDIRDGASSARSIKTVMLTLPGHSLCELSLCTASVAPCAAAWPLSWALDPHCCPSALCPNCHRHVHGCVCEFHTLISLHTLISVRQYHCQARHTEVLPDSSLSFIPRSKHCCL